MDSQLLSEAARFVQDLAAHLDLSASPTSRDEETGEFSNWTINSDRNFQVATITYRRKEDLIHIHEIDAHYAKQITKFKASNYGIGRIMVIGSHVSEKIVYIKQ